MQSATSSFRVEVVYPDNVRFHQNVGTCLLRLQTTDNKMISAGWEACLPPYSGLLAIKGTIGLLLVRDIDCSTSTHRLKASSISSSRQ
jgi:hypothetical protein